MGHKVYTERLTVMVCGKCVCVCVWVCAIGASWQPCVNASIPPRLRCPAHDPTSAVVDKQSSVYLQRSTNAVKGALAIRRSIWAVTAHMQSWQIFFSWCEIMFGGALISGVFTLSDSALIQGAEIHKPRDTVRSQGFRFRQPCPLEQRPPVAG